MSNHQSVHPANASDHQNEHTSKVPQHQNDSILNTSNSNGDYPSKEPNISPQYIPDPLSENGLPQNVKVPVAILNVMHEYTFKCD